MRFAATLLIAILVGLPLGGLMMGLINPPHHPFETASFNLSNTILLFFRTLSLGVLVSLFSLFIGAWFAWMEQRGLYRGVKLLGIMNLLPLAIPSYLLAGTLRDTLGIGGWIGKPLGLPMFTGIFPTVIVLTLITVPYVQLIVGAALTRLSREQEEAARTLGYSPWAIFQKIVLPQLRPSLVFAWLLIQLYVISDFGAVAILDYPVLTWRLYQAVEHQQLAQAILFGVLLLCMTLPILLIGSWINRHTTPIKLTGNTHPPKPHILSLPIKTMTYLLHLFVIGLGLLVPVITLFGWVLDGLLQHRTFVSLWEPLRITIGVGFFSTCFILCAAFLPAWVSARRRVKLDQMIYLINALPGILVAFGLLLTALFFSRSMPESGYYSLLLKSGILLLLGYTIRFLPNAHANLKTAILQLNPHLQDNARLLGASRWRWFYRCALPSLYPGLSAAFILTLLSVIKELPMTLLLGNAMGLYTLSFRIYDRYREAFLHDAGFAGLVLLALSLFFVLLTLRWRRHV